MAIITEDQIEKAIISVFVNNLGYRHLNCFDVDTTERDCETDVMIKPLLKRKLKELNPQLSEEVIEEAFKEICNTRFEKSDTRQPGDLQLAERWCATYHQQCRWQKRTCKCKSD